MNETIWKKTIVLMRNKREALKIIFWHSKDTGKTAGVGRLAYTSYTPIGWYTSIGKRF